MLNKKTGLIALLACFGAGEIMAGTLSSFAVGDVLVCFRNGGANDLVVDAGQFSGLTNVALNTRIPINEYTGGQLAYVSTNSVSWSAFAWLSDNTLFMTRARSSLNVQTSPWVDHSGSSQHNVVLDAQQIPPGTVDEANYVPAGAGGTLNTSTAVLEGDVTATDPDYKTGKSYATCLGAAYNFITTFQGDPEDTTPASFTTSGTVVRSDFYQLTPTSGYGLGRFLGYFEFAPDGTMTYVAYPTAVPVISSVSRSGTTTTINYTTGTYGTYTLLASSNLAAPLATWSVVTTLSTGDTLTHAVNDTDPTGTKFYIIKGQ